MAKKRRTAAPKAAKLEPEAGIAALAINPFGETQQRKIKRSKIVDSKITLTDGTQLIIRPIVSDIRRAVKQYNVDGQPLYFLTLGYSITTKAPRKLLRPKLKIKKPK